MLTENHPEIINPYPTYHSVRKETPIYRDENNTWHFTRYSDVKLLLSDDRFVRQHPDCASPIHQEKMQNSEKTELENVMSKWVLFNEPPYHTKLRKKLSQLLNPKLIKETKATIEFVTDRLIENLLKQKKADFMEMFAYPMPVQILNHLLGTSLDAPTIRGWSIAIVKSLDHGTPQDLALATPAVIEVQEYFRGLISTYADKNLKASHQCWITKLIDSNSEDPLDFEELVATCIFLLLAGHETLQLTLGLGVRSLLKNPDQLTLLQENPAFISSAIEEILRFDSSLNKVSRWTRNEIMIDGICIPKNQLVVGLINAANRDPAKFPDPDKFDITRTNNQHLTFGLGLHGCLGAFLARLELNVAFTKLLPHIHKFSLAESKTESWLFNSSWRYLFKLMIDIRVLG